MRKALLWTVVVVVVFSGFAMIANFGAKEAIAQVRAALVKNVDEPGLVPFSQTFTINSTVCGCTNCCFPETAPVPAGKRLVIQNVSGFCPLQAFANMGPIVIQERVISPVSIRTILTLPAVFRTQWNGGEYPAWEFNHLVQAYVDAGNTARLSVYTGGAWGSNGGQITINGYMVSLQ